MCVSLFVEFFSPCRFIWLFIGLWNWSLVDWYRELVAEGISWSQDDPTVAVDNTAGSNCDDLRELEEVLEFNWSLWELTKAGDSACPCSWPEEIPGASGSFSSSLVVNVVLKVCAVFLEEVEGCGVPCSILCGCPIFLKKIQR